MSWLSSWLDSRQGGGRERSDRELATTFRRALLAVLENDYDTAETLVAEAVRADSEDVDPYRSLARLYRLRGEIGRAIRIHQNLLLRRDLRDDQRNAVLAELAADYRQGGFLQRAIAAYQEVLAHDPRHPEALQELTVLLVDVRDYSQALATSRRLARVMKRKDPHGEAALLAKIAEAAHEAGEDERARKTVKRALRRDPKNADAQILLGELEAERGRSKAALAAWRTVPLAGGPRAAEVYPKLAATFAALGRARDYEAFLHEILDARPDDAVARLALADTLAARGEIGPAVLELRRVLDCDPARLEARIALGRLLLADESGDGAAKEYLELLAWLEAQLVATPAPGSVHGELE